MGTLYRAQILLEPEQHKALAELAEKDGRSMSELVREIVRHYISEKEQESRLKREFQALEKINEIRSLIQEEHGTLEGEILEKARKERDQELERIWNSKQ
jgi:predicted DNA-binding protein